MLHVGHIPTSGWECSNGAILTNAVGLGHYAWMAKHANCYEWTRQQMFVIKCTRFGVVPTVVACLGKGEGGMTEWSKSYNMHTKLNDSNIHELLVLSSTSRQPVDNQRQFYWHALFIFIYSIFHTISTVEKEIFRWRTKRLGAQPVPPDWDAIKLPNWSKQLRFCFFSRDNYKTGSPCWPQWMKRLMLKLVEQIVKPCLWLRFVLCLIITCVLFLHYVGFVSASVHFGQLPFSSLFQKFIKDLFVSLNLYV